MHIGLEARQVHEWNPELTSRYNTRMTRFLPIVVGKAYEHHVGRYCIQLLTNSCTKNRLLTTSVNCKARMVSCQYSFLCCSWSVVIWLKIRKLVSERLVRKLFTPSSDGNVTQLLHAWNRYTELSMPFQVSLGLWLHLKEIFLGLGLTSCNWD